MEEKRQEAGKVMTLVWSLCLMVIGASTIVLTVCSFAGITLPDILIRILGILNLLALPVLAFTTVKKAKKKAE